MKYLKAASVTLGLLTSLLGLTWLFLALEVDDIYVSLCVDSVIIATLGIYLYKKPLAHKINKIPVTSKRWISGYMLGVYALGMLVGGYINAHYVDKSFKETNTHLNNTNLAVALITLCVIGPIAEEVLMRGFFYRYLRRDFGIFVSACFSAIVFAIMHADITQMSYTIFDGIALALVVELYRLRTAIFTHMAMNAAAVFIPIATFGKYIPLWGFIVCIVAACAATEGFMRKVQSTVL